MIDDDSFKQVREERSSMFFIPEAILIRVVKYQVGYWLITVPLLDRKNWSIFEQVAETWSIFFGLPLILPDLLYYWSGRFV